MRTLEQKLREIVNRDRRYQFGAYEFVLEALEETMQRMDRREDADEANRHISAGDLLDGIRTLAIERFGYLGRTVFETWGVRTTGDFGEIVFNLVNQELLKRRDEDQRSDFDDVFDLASLDDDVIASIHWPACHDPATGEA